MRRVMENPHPESTISNLVLTMKQVKNRRVKTKIRELTRYHKTYTGGPFRSKTMLRFIRPVVARGIGLLTWNYTDGHSEQWLFLPKLRAAKQITVSDQSKSLLGTEFTYEDLKETDLDSSGLTYEGIAVLDTIACHLIDQQLPSSSQYAHRQVWIDQKRWLIKKVKYFDRKNRPVKILDIPLHIRKDRFWFAQKMIMRNLKSGNESILEVKDIQYNTGIVDDFFTRKFLIKID
ncbi:MAG: outer membrane lipoprotein-sorting protein [FCB group bacterium]|nr:outer membrane lipoprotein-sorting protein [FCB group bacterium]